MSEEDGNGTHVSRRELGTELRAFRWEVRALIVAAVVANGLVGHLSTDGLKTALGVGAGAVAFIVAKALLLR